MREQVQEVFNRLADEDPGPPGRRRAGRRRDGGRTRTVVLSSVILGLLIAPFGIAATGDVLREGVRNGTTTKETEIIGEFNATTGAKGGYVTRQSNTQTGPNAGGGAIYGCRGAAGGTAGGSAPCLRASNLANGLAFEFASKSGPAGLFEVASASDAPFATNGGGLVTNLNADKVDGLDAAELKGATGPAGPAGPAGPQGEPGAAATKLFAAVDSDGTLGKNSGAVSATNTGTGFYNVVFDRDISGCVYIATVGTDAFSAIPAMLSTTRTGTDTVRVRATDDAGAAFDRPFYLGVFC